MPGSLLQQSLVGSEGCVLPGLRAPQCLNLGKRFREAPVGETATWQTPTDYSSVAAQKSCFLDVDIHASSASHVGRRFLPEVSSSLSLPSPVSSATAGAPPMIRQHAAVTSFTKKPAVEDGANALDGRVTLAIDAVLLGLIAFALVRGEALKQRVDAFSEAHHRRPAPAPAAAAPTPAAAPTQAPAPAPGPASVLHADADA
mmetsp:Transcript_60617/g.112456  ORF Transcript_60617/g.112456 Transcript_60617/m.112456 type:complete len:201 (+) Transcript_60617:104-706(+)